VWRHPRTFSPRNGRSLLGACAIIPDAACGPGRESHWGGTEGIGIGVEVGELKQFVKTLDFYQSEAKKFEGLVEEANGISDESWGVIGLFVKGKYTSKLQILRELVDDLQEAFQGLGDKIAEAAKVYESTEQDHVIMFGHHAAEVDGIGDDKGR